MSLKAFLSGKNTTSIFVLLREYSELYSSKTRFAYIIKQTCPKILTYCGYIKANLLFKEKATIKSGDINDDIFWRQTHIQIIQILKLSVSYTTFQDHSIYNNNFKVSISFIITSFKKQRIF